MTAENLVKFCSIPLCRFDLPLHLYGSVGAHTDGARDMPDLDFLRSRGSGIFLAPTFPLGVSLPYVEVPGAQAGFPSPAADYEERELDLHAWLVQHPAATFFWRIQGFSLLDINIVDGDIAVVDRSITPVAGDVVIATYDGEFVAKILGRVGKRKALLSANEKADPPFPTLFLDQCQEGRIWGPVSGLARKIRR